MKKSNALIGVIRRYFPILITLIFGFIPGKAEKYAGGDISMLPAYEEAGAQYKDYDGKPISKLLPWLHQEGMNAMRVRVFVNPEKYKQLHSSDTDADTKYDPNACQSIESVTGLCKEIVNDNFSLLLDFHYSDTWADPAKQWTPVDWENLSDDQLCDKIYEYTSESLLKLKEAGVVPAFIQPGNEISYGMLWGEAGTTNPKKTLMGSDASWERLGRLLASAIRACREVCPDAGIILHTERVAQPDVLVNFYNKMKELDIDYDIIGLSYYPYFHGDLTVLSKALSVLQASFASKNIMIVETGYSYKWKVPGTTHDTTDQWPLSEAGQNEFARELVATLDGFSNCNGLFWWWMEYNAYGTMLQGWYNAPLFDSTTGKATPALKTICSFADGSGIMEINAEEIEKNDGWWDMWGNKFEKMPARSGIYIKGKKKIIIK